MDIESPPSFIVKTEVEKATHQNGFRKDLGWDGGWSSWASTTAHGTIHLAAAGPQGPWFLGIDHPGVIAELALPPADLPGPGHVRLSFPTLGALYAALDRVYCLSLSLPDAPLHDFLSRTQGMPTTTEAERLAVQRIGQDIFRARLMDYWQGRCPLTGITDPDLLRASHIRPWKDCATDADRLDVHNGLLLSALWDVAFDKGMVTFDAVGQVVPSPYLSAPARTVLGPAPPLPLTAAHHSFLDWHRSTIFRS